MQSPRFEITLHVPLDPVETWARLWNLSNHTRAVPFTKVVKVPDHLASGLGVGSTFDAQTGLGPFTVHDVMRVDEWRPPKRARIAKVGRLLGGEIQTELVAKPGGTQVRWVQTVHVRGVPDALVRLALPLVRFGYAMTVRHILAQPGMPEDARELPR